MTTKPISRQLKKQRELQAAGLCRFCGKPRHPFSKAMCPRCLEKSRKRNKGRRGKRPLLPNTSTEMADMIRDRYTKKINEKESRIATHQRWVAKYKNEIRDLREQMEQEIADHG